jgi:hypothetical protein
MSISHVEGIHVTFIDLVEEDSFKSNLEKTLSYIYYNVFSPICKKKKKKKKGFPRLETRISIYESLISINVLDFELVTERVPEM